MTHKEVCDVNPCMHGGACSVDIDELIANNLVHESSFIYLVSIPPLSWKVFVCVDGNIRKEINNEIEKRI